MDGKPRGIDLPKPNIEFVLPPNQHKGINSFVNLLSIAHISTLTIALMADILGAKDHIKFIKKFLPELYLK